MDGPTLNHYEEQLYSMFKSFDVNNEEALDESAVHELCDALQLEERGAALVDTLFEKRAGRVTFERFRSGLLAVLGDAAPRPPDPPDPAPTPTGNRADAGEEPAVEVEPSSEVEPRFMLGAKRYGRRSRPPAPRAASASRALSSPPASPPPHQRARRSVSAAPPALQHAARIDGEAALALCRDLRMDGIDRRLVERIFEDSPTPDTTVGEFFERLDSTLAREVSGAAAAASGSEPDRDGTASLERLLEGWERAGVRRPRLLLAELGLGEVAPSAAALESALDAELRALPADGEEEGRARLLAAALVLARAERATARRRADSAAAERDKLRADVAEANARAALLAREVDENHARIEREAKESLRRASARHAEEARRARLEAEAELERGAAERARLEGELARRADAEARRAAETEALATRAADLEERVGAGAAALEAARVERARLQERLRAAEESARAAAAEATRGAEARSSLAALLREHRRERDRADELAAALEATRASPAPPAPAPPPTPSDANLSAELDALLAPDVTEETETPDGARPSGAEADPSSSRTESEARSPAAVERPATEADRPTATRVEEERGETGPSGQTGPSGETGRSGHADDAEEECERLRELVKELESALEAMRCEYESCEEYWSCKQRGERAQHDAELRAADARLAALLARVHAFERRLPPAPALPPVMEQPALEDQVAALEAEHAAATRALSARLQRAHEQLARAHRRLAALQRRRDPPAPPPPPESAECARCRRLAAGAAAAGERALRAECAARRLQARLVAADLLVKDLYVENCELARHTP